eukprot:jgi/Mesvir1/3336/Mv03691-RA.1
MSTRLMDVEVEDEADYATESAPAVRGGFLDAVDLVDEDDNPVETRALPDPSQFRTRDPSPSGPRVARSNPRGGGRTGPSAVRARPGERDAPYVMKGPSLGGFAIGSMMPPVPVAPRAPPPPPPDMDQLVHEAMSPMARPEMAVIDIYDDDGESVADSFAGVGGSVDASGGGDLRTVQVTDKKSRRRGGKKKDADANKLVLDI